MKTKTIEGCLGRRNLSVDESLELGNVYNGYDAVCCTFEIKCNLYADESLERELGPERFREFVRQKMQDLVIAELREDRRIKIENAKKRKE